LYRRTIRMYHASGHRLPHLQIIFRLNLQRNFIRRSQLPQNFLASRTIADMFLRGIRLLARKHAFMKRGQRRSIQTRVSLISRATSVATQMSR
jgi:hypothetical protein